jgi:hypothetical protein
MAVPKPPTISERMSEVERSLHKLKNSTRWMRGLSLSLVVSIATLALTYFRWWEPRSEKLLEDHIDSRFEKKLKESGIHDQLDKINEKVTAIQSSLSTLQPFIHDLVQRRLSGLAVLPKPAFHENLGELANTLAVATEQDINIPGIATTLSDKLARETERGAPYWRVAGGLISYRSQTLRISPAVPDCTLKPPGDMVILAVSDPTHMTVESGHYHNCKITLDSEEDSVRLNKYMNEQTPLVEFDDCLVIYNGGPINLVLEWHDHQGSITVGGVPKPTTVSISGNALSFKNCQFVFNIKQSPPPTASDVVASVLSQRDSLVKALPAVTVTKAAL